MSLNLRRAEACGNTDAIISVHQVLGADSASPPPRSPAGDFEFILGLHALPCPVLTSGGKTESPIHYTGAPFQISEIIVAQGLEGWRIGGDTNVQASAPPPPHPHPFCMSPRSTSDCRSEGLRRLQILVQHLSVYRTAIK